MTLLSDAAPARAERPDPVPAPGQGRCADDATPVVVAVVVAYNRRDLLIRALDGLAEQARPCDAVVVVDNGSTDGSGERAAAHHLRPDVLTLERNTGGAGGFAAGLAHAVLARGADLVWLMDDDTVPTPTALSALLDARARYAGRPAL